ncbi:MAG: tryptophan 7-halogenase [Chloroflexi bacterium]|nr:tryptophan 7-halogenase [Chloroflexota bacterium]
MLKANVLGLSDGHVVTDSGVFRARCLIDASGWRAVLASSIRREFVRKADMGFGIETTVDYEGEDMHFWCDSRVVSPGVGWCFPCGGHARIGVGSYNSQTSLVANLASLLTQFHRPAAEMHGGFFPSRFRQVTVDNIFLVGDAAGQCEPLTGFGIRPALYFGAKCGDIVQKFIAGKTSLEEGLACYENLVGRSRRYYAFLGWAQDHLMSLPDPALTRWLVFFAGGR